MEPKFSEFQKQLILTWAHAHYSEWLRQNPDAKYPERSEVFLDFVASGITCAEEFGGMEPETLGL